MHRSTLLGVIAASLAATLWGGWFPLSRVMVRDDTISPEDIGFLRFSVAGLCLLPIVLRHGLKAGRAGWTGTIVLTLTVGFPYSFLLATGLQFAPAAHAAVFVPGVFPALTALLGVLILKDRPTRYGLMGMALVLLGVGAVGGSTVLGEAEGSWQGYLLFGLCAWMWAAYSITARLAQITAQHGVAIVSVLSLLVFVPVYLVFGDIQLDRLSGSELTFQILYQGIGVGLLGLIAYNYAINALGAAQAAVFGGLVPCVAALLSVPVAGEALGLAELFGIAAVTAGILMVNGARLPSRGRRAALR